MVQRWTLVLETILGLHAGKEIAKIARDQYLCIGMQCRLAETLKGVLWGDGSLMWKIMVLLLLISPHRWQRISKRCCVFARTSMVFPCPD